MINKYLIGAIFTLIAHSAITADLALSQDLDDRPCEMTVYVEKQGSMTLPGTLHEYPRSGFCCVAKPLRLSYKNPTITQLMKQAVKAGLNENYDSAIINFRRVLKISNIADARRGLFAAYAAKNGADIAQSQELGGCLLTFKHWLWVRITGTGDTFGRF